MGYQPDKMCSDWEFYGFTPYIPYSFVPPTSQYPPMPGGDRLQQLVDDLYEKTVKAFDLPSMQRDCISCGAPLITTTRGLRKFCSLCGCYLPEIIYSEKFGFTETVNPMKTIQRPAPMPTTFSH